MVGGVWMVLDQLGAVYASERSWGAALRKLRHAEAYIDEAATCGHPAAPAWAMRREPLRLVLLPEAAAATLLEDYGTPVLEREPAE